MTPDPISNVIAIPSYDSGTGITPEEEAWLARQDAFEALAANQIAVDQALKRLHPLLVPLYKQLLDKAKRMEKLGRDAARVAECNARLLGKPGKGHPIQTGP